MFNVELPDELKIPRIPLAEAQEILLKEFNKKSPVGNIDDEGEATFITNILKKNIIVILYS